MSSSPRWDEHDALEFVSLMAGGQSFCLEITSIREIRRWSPVTPLPHAEPSVLGVMNLRGAVIPIVNLAARLSLPSEEPGTRHVIVVVALGNRILGLVVEAVSEILTIKGGEIRETPTVRADAGTGAIVGLVPIGDDMSRIIDLRALLPNVQEEAA